MEASTASGIEIAMIAVERQLPRKSRIMMLVRAAARTPSWMTLVTAPSNEYRLIAEDIDFQVLRQPGIISCATLLL